MEKYELTSETVIYGVKLHRIKALKSFGNVKKGELGGRIESKKNLSQDGNAWIYENAVVSGNATVCEDARVDGNAVVNGNAWVSGNAIVCEDARVGENAWVSGNARVGGNAIVCEDARVGGNAVVNGNAWVSGNAIVCEDARVGGNAWVSGNARVSGNAIVCEDARVGGNAWVSGNARVYEDADYIVFKNWWSSGRYFTWTRSNNKWKVGCFYGSGKELIAKAYKDSEKSGREYERVVNYVESLLKEENDNENRNKREG